MKVAVLGSSGGMGRFFVRYFLEQGREVTGFDSKRGPKLTRFRAAKSNVAAVKDADLVVVATPMERTADVVEEVSGALSAGAWVVEITSVKGKRLAGLKRSVAKRRAKLLSLHPLFGPSLRSDGEMKICVIDPTADALKEARSLFPKATIIPIDARAHDKAMGVLLSLSHLVNIAYAATVSKYLSPAEFRKLETPTSSVQLTLAEGILSQSPSLYARIQLDNEHSVEMANALIEELSSLMKMVQKGDDGAFEKMFSDLARVYAGDSSSALERVYQAFDRGPKA